MPGMNRPLVYQLLLTSPSAPPSLVTRGWAWAQENNDVDLLAAIAALTDLPDQVRAQAHATTRAAVRIAWLKRADVDVTAALDLCRDETRIAVWAALCKKFPDQDRVTSRLLDVLCAKPSIGMSDLVRERTSVNAVTAAALHAIVEACAGRDMERPTAYAWRAWFARAHGPSVSTLLARTDVWDVDFLDVADLALTTDGRDDATLAADTAAVAASASGPALLALAKAGVQRCRRTPDCDPAATRVRVVVDTLLAAVGAHSGLSRADLDSLHDTLHARDDADVDWRTVPAEAGLAHLHDLESTAPMPAPPLDTDGYTFRVGDGAPHPCWADIRACLAHPDDAVAGYAWRLAYRSGMKLDWGEFPAGVDRFRTGDVWPYVRGLAFCCDDGGYARFDADTLTAVVWGVSAALETYQGTQAWRLARIRDGWLPEKLRAARRWADLPWPSLHAELLRTAGSTPAPLDAYAWLTRHVESCDNPERLWTVLDRISPTFTGSLGQLLAAGAEVCNQQVPAGVGSPAAPNVTLVIVG